MLTVKMDLKLERDLEAAARAAGLTKSEFVRRELAVAVERAKRQGAPTPWELGAELFGKVSSGKEGEGKLSQTRARDLLLKRHGATRATTSG
jgi:hypothetical protein